MTDREKDKMFFVGDVKNPLIVGKKGEIMSGLDEEFFYYLENYRWIKAGLYNLSIQTCPVKEAYAIRAFSEVDK